MNPCDQVTAELSELVDGDPAPIARHADHLAGCEDCRDARHDAGRLAAWIGGAGADHVAPEDLAARVLAAADAAPSETVRGEPHRQPDHGDIGASDPAASGPPRGALPVESFVLAGSSIAIPRAAAAEGATAKSTGNAVAAVGAAMGIGAAARSGDGEDSPAARERTAHPAPRRAARDASSAANARGPAAPRMQRPRNRRWVAVAAAAAAAAAAAISMAALGIRGGEPAGPAASGDGEIAADRPIGQLSRIERAAAADSGAGTGIELRDGARWRALGRDEAIASGAELRTDDRTRAALAMADGARLVLDHGTALRFIAGDPRRIELAAGRLAAELPRLTGRPARIATPSGRIELAAADLADAASSGDAASTRGARTNAGDAATGDAGPTTGGSSGGAPTARFTVTAAEGLTSVQVTRGAVVLASARGARDDVRAGEEGVIERGALSVSPAPGLAREAAWAELAVTAQPDEAAAGLGALRAYRPGESRDRDWNLALARHDVKVRVVGPIARTEITETFRNDSAATLEGVYQFPLPPDAQIDGLALDVAGGFVDGAFVDKQRGQKIWRGVIDRATPKHLQRPSQEIIWVEGRWKDPALLDWKRGGRFELRVYPIPAHGARTIKLAYTQVVTPRGAWRRYSYPLPVSRDGSTVADQFSVDVELRGAVPGQVRAAGYDLVADPARAQVSALTLRQAGFVPRGDLVVEYRAESGDAELRAWSYAGGAAAAPDEGLAGKRGVGIDPKVVEAQRAIAADLRPTAVLALRPHLPRWRDGAPRDYAIVVDASQSMVGERFTRATELAAALIEQMDRRDRFTAMVCDAECRAMTGSTGQVRRGRGPAIDPTGGAGLRPAGNAVGVPTPRDLASPIELRAPSAQAAGDVRGWLAAQSPAGASDVVAALRTAGARLGGADGREPWILYIGDGFATTGFRRVRDVERAVASAAGPRITTIGIGGDADAAVLQAAARGGGGSYLAWLPGQRTATAAAAALESTLGAALRDAVVELPGGLSDAAPSVLPTVRAGEEVLIAARIDAGAAGEIAGDVVLRGRVAGQPFEQRYPVRLAASSAAGNGFVPRLWATLAIEQLERAGTAADRTRIVALSQGYGVMSRETSLLVLESQAMFDAFGVDRHRPTATWTGEDALDEVASSGAIALGTGQLQGAAAGALDTANPYGEDAGRATAEAAKADAAERSAANTPASAPAAAPASVEPPPPPPPPPPPRTRQSPPSTWRSPQPEPSGDTKPPAAPPAASPVPPAALPPPPPPPPPPTRAGDNKHPATTPGADKPPTTAPEPPPLIRPRDVAATAKGASRGRGAGPGAGWIALRRIWVRVPSVTPYDAVHPAIAAAIADAEAALAASPDSRERHRALVQALSFAGELGRARDIARRWLDRDQLDPQALGYLADLLGRDGQRELALRTLAGLVDLEPDRAALHDRMARSYEQVGRLDLACGHRIAIAALDAGVLAQAGALRCLRALGRSGDAELILGALPDAAARAATEKAALVAPLPAAVTGDLVVRARWDGAADLDLTLVTPDGARVSWMGGRPDVATSDVTAADREALAVKALRRGNYLVEISRAAAIPDGAAGPLGPTAPAQPPVRGTLEITALGARRQIPFELTSARSVVGRVAVRLEERFEDLDGSPVQLYNGPDRRIVPDRR